MTHKYGDTLSFIVRFKDKKQNKEIDIGKMPDDPYIWFVANDKDAKRVLWREQKSPGFEFKFDETKHLYPGEYNCEVGIRYGDEGFYRYQTKNAFTLTVVKGERVPVQEEREVW